MLLNKHRFSLLLLIVLTSCTRSDNDVYHVVSPDSKLSIDVIRKSSQFIRDGDENLLLLYDISHDWRYINNHVLIYDATKLTLKEASYVPVNKIDSVSAGMIYGVINSESEKRSDLFRSEPLRSYQLKLAAAPQSGSRVSDKLIDSIKVKADWTMELYVRKSEDPFAGLRPVESNELLATRYSLYDTVHLNIGDVFIGGSDRNFHYLRTIKGEQVDEVMLFRDDKILEGFRNEVFALMLEN